jgi:hypothetical protein
MAPIVSASFNVSLQRHLSPPVTPMRPRSHEPSGARRSIVSSRTRAAHTCR